VLCVFVLWVIWLGYVRIECTVYTGWKDLEMVALWLYFPQVDNGDAGRSPM